MALNIDVKRFHTPNGTSFIAIAPIWSEYATYHKQKPINQIKLEGVTVRELDLARFTHCNWHPDNPFSEEKWMEVRLYQCKWELNANKEYSLISRTPIGQYGTRHITDTLFFVSARQVRAIYGGSPDGELMYKSNDRAEFEAREYVKAWAEAQSSAVSRSYH